MQSGPHHALGSLLHGFFSFLLSGEVMVPSAREYIPGGHLSEGDVTLDNVSAPTLVQVRIKASKTDPFRKGVVVYLGRTDKDLCPVGAVAAYLAVRGREPSPFFKFGKGTPLSRTALVSRMRTALGSSGVDASKYSGHSFRIGVATTAASAGIEDSLIKTLGRWESAAYLLYIRVSRDRSISVSWRLSVA